MLGDRPPPLAVAAHLLASVYHDAVFRLPRIAAPTLVLHGDRDAMSPPANAELLAARIPDARLALVRSAGHAYLLEQPEQSYQLLVDWLTARSPVPPGPRRRPALEPRTRRLGLPDGALRTGASLLALPGSRPLAGRSPSSVWPGRTGSPAD